jgi:hypothetical protein
MPIVFAHTSWVAVPRFVCEFTADASLGMLRLAIVRHVMTGSDVSRGGANCARIRHFISSRRPS